ncbi:hypothetical protein QMZ92_15435 [Streptomyces sp. HNM0645]|uniref:hypothetical protein n=1 Tax=Streptomyces sp. HNM0645 TaxID=2782343 RepID=UPI0024B7E474|nr:hypothetical protein [Streptomyces sp. HNM0645]MDI9885736.1 hypothetical protein [Streptomyces sp. HNM0645]
MAVRRLVLNDPDRGLGDRHCWFAASQRLGDLNLREADADLAVIVEGIDWTGIPVGGTRRDGGAGLSGGDGLRPSRVTHEAVRDERQADPGRDRASGHTNSSAHRGTSRPAAALRGAALSAALCAGADGLLGAAGRTVCLDRSSPGAGGGDFAHGRPEPRCTTDEYAAGSAPTGRPGPSRTPDAPICRTLR